jgi:hypothetical protein
MQQLGFSIILFPIDQPCLNGGTGGRNPQIRVLPSLGKPKPASIDRLPIRLSLISESNNRYQPHKAPYT